MAEAAQVAGAVVSRSRVGLCDRAARQWKVTPGMRLHVPTVPLCASPEASVRPHTHRTPSCSTLVTRNGRGSVGLHRRKLPLEIAPRGRNKELGK